MILEQSEHVIQEVKKAFMGKDEHYTACSCHDLRRRTYSP